MSIRPFDWRDYPVLQRWRNQSVILDSALAMTRGPRLVPGTLISYLAPLSTVMTYVHTNSRRKPVVVAQGIHQKGSPFARLTFLSPESAVDTPELATLLDALMTLSGDRGAYHLLAEVDEKSPAFEPLRRAGFGVYSHQYIWRFSETPEDAPLSSPNIVWRSARSKDFNSIRTLYNILVPGLVQQVEAFSLGQTPGGLLVEEDGEIQAYTEIISGPQGIWVQPFFHPDAQDITGHFLSLFTHLPNRRSRPIFICVRSYQSWLEPALEELDAIRSPRQALMVKHLTILQKASRPITVSALEASQPEISAPIARSESRT